MNKVLARLGLLIGGVATALLAAELAVRLGGLAPRTTSLEIDTANGAFVRVDDPALKYVPKAGSHDINADGIRDHLYSREKPPGTFRIVVIGDSVAFGMCNQDVSIPIDRTFAKLMEARLNQLSHPGVKHVEVINLGVPGYDTLNEAAFFRLKGLALSPDLVLVAYVLNDNYEASAELLEFRKNTNWIEPAPIARELFRHSHLLRFVWQRIAQVNYRTPVWKRPTVTEVPRSDHVERGFEQLAELRNADHFNVLVAVFPVFYGENWRSRPDIFDNYPRAAEHDVPRSEAAKYGFMHVDLLEAFRKAANGDARRLQGSCNAEHPNEAGHEVAAAALSDYLERGRVIAR